MGWGFVPSRNTPLSSCTLASSVVIWQLKGRWLGGGGVVSVAGPVDGDSGRRRESLCHSSHSGHFREGTGVSDLLREQGRCSVGSAYPRRSPTSHPPSGTVTRTEGVCTGTPSRMNLLQHFQSDENIRSIPSGDGCH